MPHGKAAGIADVEGDKAVTRHGEIDCLDAGHFLGLDQSLPVDHRQTVIHPHRKLAAVGEPNRSQRNMAARFDRCDAPDAAVLEREDAIDRFAGPEDVLDGKAAIRSDSKIRLDRHDDLVARLRRPPIRRQHLPRHRQSPGCISEPSAYTENAPAVSALCGFMSKPWPARGRSGAIRPGRHRRRRGLSSTSDYCSQPPACRDG